MYGHGRTSGVGAAPPSRRSNEAIWPRVPVPRIAYLGRDEKKTPDWIPETQNDLIYMYMYYTGYCSLFVVLCCGTATAAAYIIKIKIFMLLLNWNAHKSCAWCGVAAASSYYTVCMLYGTCRVPAQRASMLLFMHVTLNTLLAVSRTAGAAAAAACCLLLNLHARKSCTALYAYCTSTYGLR